jgi:hypothetical protein
LFVTIFGLQKIGGQINNVNQFGSKDEPRTTTNSDCWLPDWDGIVDRIHASVQELDTPVGEDEKIDPFFNDNASAKNVNHEFQRQLPLKMS